MNEGGAPLRIAHLSATFPPYPGGAGNTCFRIAVEQASRGHSVEVFTAPAEGEPPDAGGAVIHRIEPAFAIGNAPLIPRIASVEGFDVVHIHYPFIFGSELALLGRLSRRRRRQALLVHYKNKLIGDGLRGPLFAAYEHTVAPLLVRAADRVCVLSREHAESVPYLARIAARDPQRLAELPNGVDTELFSPDGGGAELRVGLGIPADAIAVAFVATLDRAHHFKRLDLAIEAFARTGDERLHLVVAGDGDLRPGFERQAAEAGVADRIHFLGRVEHRRLPDVLRASDLFLLTTQPPESFGIVLIEAMACALPVIATEYPGVEAVLDPGENGLLVPPGDPDRVAAALRGLADAPKERRRLGDAGRAKAERLWNWPRLIEHLDEIYREAIEERARKQGR